MRAGAPEEQEFREWSLALGDGRLPTFGPSNNIVRLPDECVLDESDSLITAVFGQQIDVDSQASVSRCILATTNLRVLELNNQIIQRLDGPEHTLLSEDSIIDEGEGDDMIRQYPIESVHDMLPSGLPPHKLVLKQNAIVMLLCNIDTTKGFCNGTRMLVKEVRDRLLVLEVLCGPNKGNVLFLPRFSMQERDSRLPFKIKRVQFPVRLSYAMTINKAQGQTFDYVGIDLTEPVFAHGQLYVAVSRVRAFRNLKFRISTLGNFQGRQTLANGVTGVFTTNLVYRSILNIGRH